MDYAANAIGQQYAGAQQANAYPTGAAVLNKPSEAPKTLASATGRLDHLNDRLAKVMEALGSVASQIGSMTPLQGASAEKPPAIGAVYRLNDLADDAHIRLTDIENLVGGIQRALG